MAKITVCDKCKAEKGIFVQTNRFMKVPKHPELRIDLCDDCMKSIGKMPMKDYVKLAYKLVHNMDLDKDPAMLKLVLLQLHITE